MTTETTTLIEWFHRPGALSEGLGSDEVWIFTLRHPVDTMAVDDGQPLVRTLVLSRNNQLGGVCDHCEALDDLNLWVVLEVNRYQLYRGVLGNYMLNRLTNV